MATWKKVIVSGSNAVLGQLNVGTNQQITSLASTTLLSGSFSGSFTGNGSGLTGVIATAGSALSQSTGIVAFSYNGGTAATVAVSGASSLSSNKITKWTGNAFANSSLTDSGTTITGTTSIQLTGASSNLSGSFSGSFQGDGSNLTGLVSTLSISGSNNTSGSVSLLTQGLIITGTTNEVETSVSGQTVTIGLPDNVTLGGDLTINGNDIKSNGGTTAITLSSADVTVAGDLQVNGNDIKASDGNTNISLTSNTLTTFAGDIRVSGNDIQSSAGTSVFSLSGANATANGNLTVSGDLTVAGTASFQNQTSLVIADRFILLASGSTSLTDGGFIVNSGGVTGSAFYLESTSTGTYGRFAVVGNANASASALIADEFAVTAKQASGAPSGDPTWGGSANGFGNIYVDSGTGDIYVYSW